MRPKRCRRKMAASSLRRQGVRHVEALMRHLEAAYAVDWGTFGTEWHVAHRLPRRFFARQATFAHASNRCPSYAVPPTPPDNLHLLAEAAFQRGESNGTK